MTNIINCVKPHRSHLIRYFESQGKGKTMPYIWVNGHMFSYIGEDGKVALRLSKKE